MRPLDSESHPEFGDTASAPPESRRGAGKRYVDTFFRHWIIALIPILVLPLAGVAVALTNHGNSTATANVWVNQTATKQLGYADPLATPATNAATALTQLFQTESFDVLIAHDSPLYWNTVVGKPNRNATIVTDLSKSVQIVAKGPDLVNFSYSSKNPLMGMQLLQSVLKEAPRQIQKLNHQQLASNLVFYEREKKAAQARLAQATRELGAYMKRHHVSATQMAEQSLFDPSFAALYQASQSDQVAIDNADHQISQATSPNIGNTFQVFDRPSAIPASRSKKQLALDAIVGLLVGLLLSGAFVVGCTAADHSIRHSHEVPDLLGLPILASVPYSEAVSRSARPFLSSPQSQHISPGRQG